MKYCVYWYDIYVKDAMCRMYENLSDAITWCQTLRENPENKFVTMAVEDPNHVGKMGVTEVDESYDWVKRRDAISVRRKSIDTEPKDQ